MSDAMRQNLIGYLLQAIEPDEHAAVEEHLAKDPALKNDCELLRACFSPLAHDKDHHEPPQGLANRCCDFVYSRTEIMPVAVTSAGDGHTISRRRWSWLDLSVAGAIAAAVAVLFVPAIFQSQVMAQRTACQKNLQDIGTAMVDYSNRNDGYFPIAHPDDRVHLASVWGPKLKPTLPRGDRTLVCPSDPLAEDATFRVPSMKELEEMRAEQVAKIRSRLSGNYAATVGYQEGGKYKLSRKSNRTNFALVSDAPGPKGTNSPNHGGEGQNVLFEDMHVNYLKSPHADPDTNIFLNDDGEEAPGRHPGDAVISRDLQLP